MLAGKVGDEDVLIVRKGDEFFALDAFCTHYHGPLAEGLLVGDTIRCPWHHACFELRTGSASGAPAMRPLRVYSTVRAGDTIRVVPDARVMPVIPSVSRGTWGNGRHEDDPAHHTSAQVPRLTLGMTDTHIVIVGAGAAGSFAAAERRRSGFGGRVTLLSAEERLPYDKPNLSKDYLAGRAPQEWIPLRGEEDYASDRIELRLQTTV